MTTFARVLVSTDGTVWPSAFRSPQAVDAALESAKRKFPDKVFQVHVVEVWTDSDLLSAALGLATSPTGLVSPSRSG